MTNWDWKEKEDWDIFQYCFLLVRGYSDKWRQLILRYLHQNPRQREMLSVHDTVRWILAEVWTLLYFLSFFCGFTFIFGRFTNNMCPYSNFEVMRTFSLKYIL